MTGFIGCLLLIGMISGNASKKQALIPDDFQLTHAEIEHARELIGNNDCITCHTIDTKVIGPAFSDVAKKYNATPANVNKLVQKITNGGSGAWGDIPMTPHKSTSENDIKQIVIYILSLKNQQ